MFRIVKGDGVEAKVYVTPCWASVEHLQRVAEENRLFAQVGAAVREAVDRRLAEPGPRMVEVHGLVMNEREAAQILPWDEVPSDLLGDMLRGMQASKRVLSDPDFTLTEESDPGG